jgi:hypothetical protein
MKAIDLEAKEVAVLMFGENVEIHGSSNATSLYIYTKKTKHGNAYNSLTRISNHLPKMYNLQAEGRLEGVSEITFVFYENEFFQSEIDLLEKELNFLEIECNIHVIESEEDLNWL